MFVQKWSNHLQICLQEKNVFAVVINFIFYCDSK